MKPDPDPDVFLSEINQICDEIGVLDETVSTERLTTVWMLGRDLNLTREHLAVAPCTRLTQFFYH